MPTFSTPLCKLSAVFNDPIHYSLPFASEGETFQVNELIGKKITITFNHAIYCIQCNRKTAKSFQQGYCYPCYRKLLDCNLCMIHPEKCNYPKQDCPDTWEHEQCKQPHVIYLANSSGLKVGITRHHNLPTRWIDQGASQGITLFKVTNRYHSGIIEVLFKQFVADKTNWRKMLASQAEPLDMTTIKNQLLAKATDKIAELSLNATEIDYLNDPCVTLTYPIIDYPKKLTAFSLEKQPIIEDILLGIKGQYLLFENGVFNIRKHSGFLTTFSW